MLKLYKSIDNILHYWETWNKNERSAMVRYGIVGDIGQTKEVKSGLFSNFRKFIEKEIAKKRKDGYNEIDTDDMEWLEIEYVLDDFGTKDELDKRHALEDVLEELLEQRGLGNTNGGSIGSNTMEAGCFVVDYDIAKKVVETHLKGTVYGDYSRIYKKENWRE